MTERELLTRYATDKDQEAFGQLVRLHMDWVYGCARRMVHDPAGAEDVAQAVFILLARKAGSLRRETQLAGWLFRATRYCTSEAMRGKARRLKHEREAAMLRNEITVEHEANWGEIRPVVDEAVASLGSTDRDVVLLRFFRGMSLEEVGAAMGTSEEAAKKRVQRAVGKLRELLERRGVSTPAGTLTGMMAMNLAEHAPAALVEATVQSATAAGTAAVGSAVGLAKGAQTLFVVAKVKAAAAVVAVSTVAVGAGTVAVVSATTPSAPAAATQPVAVAPAPAAPAVVPEPLDGLYEKARRSSPDLEIMAGPNRFRVTGVVRWNGEQMVTSDGRGGTWSADPAVLQQIQGPRYPSEDVAVVFVNTPPERFDARRLRVFDHDRRQYLQSAAITRVRGASAFRISHWFAPLPPRIDLWLDLASHAADSQATMLEPKPGAAARIGEATVRVREARDGHWRYGLTQGPELPAEIKWDKPDDQGERSTIVLDCIGPWQGGRYQLSAVTASGHKVMSDFLEDFGREVTTIRTLPVGLNEVAAIELRPFARPGPFFFDGIAVPQRTASIESFASPPPVPIEEQWEVRLNSGPTVSVVALADPDRPGVWWTPDGEPTEKPSPEPGGAWVSLDDTRIRRVVCLRITGLPDSGSVHATVTGSNGGATSSTNNTTYITTTLPKGLETTSVLMGASTQPWKIVEESPLEQKGWLKAVPMYIRSVQQSGGKASVAMDWVGLPNGMTMEFIGTDGKVHHWNSMRSQGDEVREFGLPHRTVLGFDNVPAGLKTLRIKWRPIEYVEFKGVRVSPK